MRNLNAVLDYGNLITLFSRMNDPGEERCMGGNLNLNHLVIHESLELEAEINNEEVHNALNSF